MKVISYGIDSNIEQKTMYNWMQKNICKTENVYIFPKHTTLVAFGYLSSCSQLKTIYKQKEVNIQSPLLNVQ